MFCILEVRNKSHKSCWKTVFDTVHVLVNNRSPDKWESVIDFELMDVTTGFPINFTSPSLSIYLVPSCLL